MKATDIVGYAADADTYCPKCAAELYPAKCTRCGLKGKLSDPGWHDWGECNDVLMEHDDWPRGFAGYFRALDGEGNEVYPIFADDEWDYLPICRSCGAEIDILVLEDK